MKTLFILLLALYYAIGTFAQTTVSGKVESVSGEPLQGCTVLFLQADSIVGGTITSQKGIFEIKNLTPGNYVCKVSMIGFKFEEYKFKVSNSKTHIPTITLKEDAMLLDEINVAGDLANVKAGMTTYHLSERAKSSRNAYEALMEIPELIVDPVSRSISMGMSGSPLILIDGVKRTNYMDVLNPETIESIEVIQNPSARYMNDENVSCILNIKLKRVKTPVYLRGDIGGMANTRFDNLNFLANAEIGNTLSSIYLTGGYKKQTDKMDLVSNSLSGNLERNLKGRNVYSNVPLNLTLGGDKVFSDKNYAAFNVSYNNSTSETDQEYTGETFYTTSDEVYDIVTSNNTYNTFHDLASNLYWKHTFAKNNQLELTGNYNYSYNNSNGLRNENSGLYSYTNRMNMVYSQHFGKLNVDYSKVLKNKTALAIGSNTNYLATNMDNRTDQYSDYLYKRWQEYLYIGLDNNRSRSKFNYVLSLGLDYVSSEADKVKNDYINLLPSISASYRFNKNHQISFNYRRNRTTPGMDMLNPRNTSTDSLAVTHGNPYLHPYSRDLINLRYTFKYKKFEMQPYMDYRYMDGMFMAVGRTENDIYYTTYENVNHKQIFILGNRFQYKLPSGGISLNIYWRKDKMDEMSFSGKSWGTYLNFWKFYKRISTSIDLQYEQANYSTYTTKKEPTFASKFNLSWMMSDKWILYVNLRNILFHNQATKVCTKSDNYRSFSSQLITNRRPELTFTVSYSFKNKVKVKNRKKKKFSSSALEMKDMNINNKVETEIELK